MAFAELAGLKKASLGFSKDSQLIFSFEETNKLPVISSILFRLIERFKLPNYNPVRNILVRVANFVIETDAAKFERLNHATLIFPAHPEIQDSAVILNPINGAKFLLSKNELSNLISANQEHRLDKLPEKMRSELIKMGIILEKEVIYYEKKDPSDTLNIWLDIGFDCVNRCGFSWQGQGLQVFDHVKAFEETEVDEFANGVARSMIKMGVRKLNIKYAGGGEPLVYFENMRKLTPLITEKINSEYKRLTTSDTSVDIEYVVITSIIGLDDKMCSFFKENNFHLAVAVGGDILGHWMSRSFTNGTNSWKHVLTGIKYLIDFEVSFNLSYVLCDKNISTIYRDELDNIFLFFDMMYGRYIPIDFSLARPSALDKNPISDINKFNEYIANIIPAFLNYQKRWLGKIDYPKFDYVSISSVGAGKSDTCFAGDSYIGIASYSKPRPILNIAGKVREKILQFSRRFFLIEQFFKLIPERYFINGYSKLSIGACHEIADSSTAYDTKSNLTMLEQANQAFKRKEGKNKKRPHLTKKEAYSTCVGCAIRNFCSGIDEIGGCVIQRNNFQDGKLEVKYCPIYSKVLEIILIRYARVNPFEIFFHGKKPTKWYSELTIHRHSSDLSSKYLLAYSNILYRLDEMNRLKIKLREAVSNFKKDNLVTDFKINFRELLEEVKNFDTSFTDELAFFCEILNRIIYQTNTFPENVKQFEEILSTENSRIFAEMMRQYEIIFKGLNRPIPTQEETIFYWLGEILERELHEGLFDWVQNIADGLIDDPVYDFVNAQKEMLFANYSKRRGIKRIGLALPEGIILALGKNSPTRIELY